MIKKNVDYQAAIDLINELLKDEHLSVDQKQYLINRVSGLYAEKQTAYRLETYFGDKRDILVINNLKISHNDQNTQIDHLVISRKGMYFVESKSLSERISVNEYDEWVRYYGKKVVATDSPVEQVNLQGKKLFCFLQDNLSEFRKSLLGFQGQIGYYLDYYFVAISKKGRIDGKGRNKYKDVVIKYDMIPKEIEKRDKRTLLQKVALDGNFLQRTELEALADFLLKSDISIEPIEEIRQWAKQNGLIQTSAEPQQNEAVEDRRICPECRKEARSIKYGKYGYYFLCEACGKSSSIKETCPSCSQPAKIKKEKESYYLVCRACELSQVYFVNPVAQRN